MSRFVFVVFTGPVKGREGAFNRWYDDKHLPEVLAIRGCTGAQRFRYADGPVSDAPGPYLALYEWEAAGWEEARAALDEAREAGLIDIDASLDPGQTRSWFYEAIGDRREG